MKWPFRKKEYRTGAGTGGSYTDALVSAIMSAATGNTLAVPGATAAIETVSGLVSRAFASAEISGPFYVVEALTPSMLALIARGLVRRGESVLRIDVRDGRIVLFPASEITVTGHSDPRSWVYQLSEHGPSSTTLTRNLAFDSVMHVMYSRDSARPWRGVGPIQSADISARLCGALAAALADEAGGPRGRLLPVPQSVQDVQEGEVDPIDLLKADLANLGGGLAVVESMADSFQAGVSGRAPSEWAQKRIGAEFPDAMVKLQELATREILAAFGLSSALFSESQGTASREAWRQALHGVITPLARLLEEEVRVKLDAPDFAMSFDRLAASDISGRARAFQSLVGGGMDVAKAAALSGLIAME